jgi:hypothetical protein
VADPEHEGLRAGLRLDGPGPSLAESEALADELIAAGDAALSHRRPRR